MTIGGSPCIPGDISLSYSGGSIPDSIFWKSSPDAQPEQVNTIILDGAIIWQGNLRPQKVVFYPDTSTHTITGIETNINDHFDIY